MSSPPVAPSNHGQVVPQVEAAVRDWEQGGRATVLEILKATSQSGSSSLLTTLPCHLALRTLFRSPDLTVEQLVQVLTEAVVDQQDLLETILDVTETIEQEIDDVKDLVQNGTDVAQDDKHKSPSKALNVVKALLQSGVMPSHLPSLLLSLSHFPHLSMMKPGQPVMALQRLHTRRYTNAVIRQLKHNLLRESSEGFSALIIVLTDHATHKRPAAETWAKSESIMGYFNLSPTRVLDVLLDVFACSFEHEWVYWLDVLKCTPWGLDSSWKGSKGKGRATAEDVAQLDTDKIEPFILKEAGHRVLAEVLGFKFAEYQREESSETTSMGLVYVAALLIKEGFVKSLDLLPFLTPDEKQLAAIATKYTDDIRAKAGSGASNALANAAALTDEPDVPAGASTTSAAAAPVVPATEVPPLPRQIPDQRIQLLQAFLGLGYISGAYFILASSPTLAQSHPAVSDHLLRLMSFAIEPVYQSAVRNRDDDQGEWDFSMPKRTFLPPITRRTTPTHILPLPSSTQTEDFDYFYPSWADGLETWSTPEEMWTRGSKLFKLVGGLGSRDIGLATKVARIAASCFGQYREEKEKALGLPPAEQSGLVAQKLEAPLPSYTVRSLETERLLVPTEKEMAPWLLLLRAFLLPSMSLSEANSAYAREIWELLRYLPYHVRYSLYGEWRDVIASTTNARSMSAMTLGAYEAERTTKTAMRKLTKTDFKSSGRILAKVAQSNPCAMWRVIMDQVKAYAITGQVVPEAMRYMPLIAYDVITFAVLDEMAAPPKTQAQAEAKTGHVYNLSKFLGEACRRHNSIELDPIIQFIVNRLQSRSPNDLVVLGTLITIMSGDEPLGNSSISDAQFASLAGGPELVREGLYETREAFTKPVIVEASIAVRDAGAQAKAAAPTKRSLKRLIDALRATGLAVPTWIALAQARQGSLAQMEGYPAKAMAKGFDDAHDVFLQYSALLSDQFTDEEHIQLMPPLDELVRDYHLDEAVAFHMLRGKLTAEMKKAHKVEGDALQRRLTAEKAEAERVKESGVKTGSEEPVADTEAAVTKPKRQWWPTALHEVMLQSKEILPMDAARNQTILPCPFYAFFWQMSLMDLEVPIASYDLAISRLQKTANEIKTWKALPGARFPRQPDIAKEVKRFEDRVTDLTKEREVQMSNVSGLYRKSLRQRSAKWFEGYGASLPDQRRLARELYQRCFFPRAIMSPADAAYVAKMIARLHEYGCQGFSVLYAYDHFFSEQLAAAIYTCTDDEARNFGRCLAVILGELNKWHIDEAAFKEGALGIGKSRERPSEPTLPGFQLRSKAADGSDAITHMSWSDFRRWMLKVHKNLAQAIVSCLKQGDYRHVFNGITVAQKVLDQFPLEEQNGKDVLQALQLYTGSRLQADGTLKATEEGSNVREDIQNLANSYQSQLNQRRQARPWLSLAKFCPPVARVQAAAALKSTTSNAMDVDTPAKVDEPAIPTGPSAARGLSRTNSSRVLASPAADGRTPATDVAALRARVTESRVRPAADAPGPNANGSGRATPVAPTGPRRPLPPHLADAPPINGDAARGPGSQESPSSSAAIDKRPGGEASEEEKLAHQRILDARARKFQTNSPSSTPSHSRDITPPATRPPPREPSGLVPGRRRRSTSVESRASDRSRRGDPRDERSRPRDERDRSRRDGREHRDERDRDGRSSRRSGGDDGGKGDRLEPPSGPADGGRSKRPESGRERERDERRERDRTREDRPEREGRRDRDRRRKDDEGRERTRDKETSREKDSSRDKHRDREGRSSRRDKERDEGRAGGSRELLPPGDGKSSSRRDKAGDEPRSAPVKEGTATPMRPAPVGVTTASKPAAPSPHGLPPKPNMAPQAPHTNGRNERIADRMANMAPPPVPSALPMRPHSPAQRPASPVVRENAASPRPDKRPIEDVAAPEAPEAKKGPAVKIDRQRGKSSRGPSSLMSAMTSAVRSVNDQK